MNLPAEEAIAVPARGHDEPVAPLWHSGFMLVVFMVLPMLPYMETLRRGAIHLRSGSHLFKVWTFSIGLGLELVLWLLVYLGLFLQGTKVVTLAGETWHDLSGAARDIGYGLFTAFAGMIVMGLVLYFGHAPRPHNEEITPRTLAEIILFFLLLLSGAVMEELIFRGYFLMQMTHYLDNRLAANCIQALIFATCHGIGDGFAGLLSKMSLGLLFGVVAMRRGSLAPTMVAHVLINTVAGIAILVK
jgi:membrane protease YdiL (CAAX protease family)